MLFSADAWPGIADGSITVTVRTWTKPQARTGGRYRVAGMLIEADDVSQVAVESLTVDDARRSGHDDLAGLLARLGDPEPGTLVWRVRFHFVGQDDRIVRRQDDRLTDDDVEALRLKLDRLDRRPGGPPWTRQTLRLIETYPGVVSTALARQVGYERAEFKVRVRALKELGLTESLSTGYRLSPRGEALLRALG